MIESVVAYHKTDETDLLRSKRGSCSSGGVWRTAKRDSTRYCSSPPSTPSSLHELLFIHRPPPPASTCDCSSMGSCSSSLHRGLLHRLLLNQPSPRDHVQPPLHRLLFIQPSTFYCSSSPPHHGGLFNHPSTGTPPPSTVHPALHGVVLFIQPSMGSCSSSPNRLDRLGSCSSRGNHGVLFIHPHRELFIQPPQQCSLFIQRQHRSASVSSSEGIARSGSVNNHRSITRVQ